ncbi:outer membrane biogenesis protein BamB [Caulifigura coniformis]|uniref:Outer membrane biogenesis protein BamB n=1 Tax=Caulifigura coniformis TaxID=2527983 RepID=A0A517SLF8_9PLAN|nr:PQQ-binding-like beta-propeller repeat protein [Caulifigura coniformis]QDT56957.1 outer membrane biogenesis protein BamB [Caulifigura coniformis]
MLVIGDTGRAMVRAVAAVCLFGWSHASGDDWPQWLGPGRNNVSTEVVAPWKEPPSVAWRQKVGHAQSSPVVAGGRVFIHSVVAGEEKEEVLAFDATTGELRWRDAYERGAYRSQQGPGPRATPSVMGGRVYTTGITGILGCYDCESGKRLWQANPYEELGASLPGFGVCSSPAVTASRVILPVGGKGSAVVAYDAQTGKLAWQKFDEPAAASSPVVVTRGEGDKKRTEVIVQTTLRVMGLNPDDGTVHWEHPLVFQPSGVAPTPLTTSSLLICSTQDNGTIALSTPSADGVPRQAWWKQDLSSYFSTGTLDVEQNRVFLLTNQLQPLPRADLVCIDLESGSELWSRAALGYFHAGVIMTGDGKLLILDDSGNLVLAEAAKDRFVELAKAKVCRGTFVNPAISGGLVYVRDDQELIALRVPATARAENGSQ